MLLFAKPLEIREMVNITNCEQTSKFNVYGRNMQATLIKKAGPLVIPTFKYWKCLFYQ